MNFNPVKKSSSDPIAIEHRHFHLFSRLTAHCPEFLCRSRFCLKFTVKKEIKDFYTIDVMYSSAVLLPPENTFFKEKVK